MAELPDVRQVSTRLVYENPWMSLTEDVVERGDGSTGAYAVVHAPDFVLVIPFDGERYHLVEQYRYPAGGRFWEFPQGVAKGEAATPEEMAAAELAEEAGLTADLMTPLGFLHHAYGRTDNGFHAFLATGLAPTDAVRDPEELDMRAGSFTAEELWDLVASRTLTDSASLAAWALLEHHRASAPDSRGIDPSRP